MDDEPNRVYRGGSWSYLPSFARVAYRLRLAPGSRTSLGVRLIRVVDSLQQLAEVTIGK